jgi:hypothetical protein
MLKIATAEGVRSNCQPNLRNNNSGDLANHVGAYYGQQHTHMYCNSDKIVAVHCCSAKPNMVFAYCFSRMPELPRKPLLLSAPPWRQGDVRRIYILSGNVFGDSVALKSDCFAFRYAQNEVTCMSTIKVMTRVKLLMFSFLLIFYILNLDFLNKL